MVKIFKKDHSTNIASRLVHITVNTLGKISKCLSNKSDLEKNFVHSRVRKPSKITSRRKTNWLKHIGDFESAETTALLDKTTKEKLKHSASGSGQVVGFTKYTCKRTESIDTNFICNVCPKGRPARRPAQICKPLRTLCKPRSRMAAISVCDYGTLSDMCEDQIDSALRISPSVASICAHYRGKCLPSATASKLKKCCPCGRNECRCSSVESFICAKLSLPGPPLNSDINCSKPETDNEGCSAPRQTGGSQPHPMPKPKTPFEPIPFPKKIPCLPLPPILPKPDFSCPCTCDCGGDSDSDAENDCQNSIEGESQLTKFFEDKMKALVEELKTTSQKVQDETEKLEKSYKEKMEAEAEVCSAEKRVLNMCRSVKKIECDLLTIKNRICLKTLYCKGELKADSFCCKIAVQHVRVLQSKLEKVRSGATLKQKLLDMCEESRKRTDENNKTLKENIKSAQQIAKDIKKKIDEIKEAICYPQAGGGAPPPSS